MLQIAEQTVKRAAISPSFPATPSASLKNGPKKALNTPLTPSSRFQLWYRDTKDHPFFVDVDPTQPLDGQARQLIKACEAALSSGIFYAPVAACTEEAADVAAQQMELRSTEWFQLPKAATGLGVCVLKRDPSSPHQITCGQLSKCLLDSCRRTLGEDLHAELSDLGPKRRPVQETVRKNKEPDIQLENRRLPLLQDPAQPQKRNRFPVAAQVAHMNEDLEYLQEESAYLISGTPDVEISLAVKVKTTKDLTDRYQDPHMAFFGCSFHNGYVVHHGGLDFGAGSDCVTRGLNRYRVRLASDPLVHEQRLEGLFVDLNLYDIYEDLRIRFTQRSAGGQLSMAIGIDHQWPVNCGQAVRDVIQSLQLLDAARVPVNERPQLLIEFDRDF